MDCPICNQPTEVVRTLHAGDAGKSVERRCPKGHRWTYAVQLVGPIKKRGDGAHAIATKMTRGENPIPEKPYAPPEEKE